MADIRPSQRLSTLTAATTAMNRRYLRPSRGRNRLDAYPFQTLTEPARRCPPTGTVTTVLAPTTTQTAPHMALTEIPDPAPLPHHRIGGKAVLLVD